MEWHIFAENQRRTPAPGFRLPSNRGGTFSLDDYRGWGNVVLFFSHGLDCAACRAALGDFAAHRAAYGAQEAKIVPVIPGSQSDLTEMVYPFALLSDPRGIVRQKYADLLGVEPEKHAMVFVLDRYGAPYAGSALLEADDPELQAGVLEWLDFIEIQCPE
jgi:peroxiredoxin